MKSSKPGVMPVERARVASIVRMAVHGCDHFIARVVVRGAWRRAERDVTGRWHGAAPALSLNFTASDFGRYGSRLPMARQSSGERCSAASLQLQTILITDIMRVLVQRNAAARNMILSIPLPASIHAIPSNAPPCPDLASVAHTPAGPAHPVRRERRTGGRR
ncbi:MULTISPECIES: hypothetical protein [unclassified Burkholderia]|uniref:hypothetical protein n=1 Tax=unclassified Burkholderia TaxID=2613784 RepID=UPI0015C674A1|nr:MULTISPECIES: hypothetical protein [unclassified Burkholderia]